MWTAGRSSSSCSLSISSRTTLSAATRRFPALAGACSRTITSRAAARCFPWFGTAVRVIGKDAQRVADCSEVIREAWCSYEDKARGIIPEDKDGVHSAVSPTVVKTARGYEMNLILRNNITTEEYPDGVFHAHPEFHVIKKESIGLIEAQGLFILPGRLVEELADLEKLLVSGEALPEKYADYQMIFGELKAMAPSFTAESAHEAVKKELASVCERILGNTAVFKTQAETAQFMIEKAGFIHD